MSERLDACNDVHDDLAAIVDGDSAARRRHADHLAACDGCRDLRHAAQAAAEALADAGADFVVPHDLEDRIRFALSTRKDAAPAPAPAPLPEAAASPRPVLRSVSAPIRAARPVLRVVATGSLAAAAAIVVALVALGPAGVGLWGPSLGVGPAARPTTATVTRLVRAAPDGATGLSIRAAQGGAFTAATAGAELAAGAIVRTDPRTRVEITLSDGSVVVLDHETEVALDPDLPRSLHVARGEVVAEVAHVPGAPPLTFATPTGTVEVLGTRLALSASESTASVRVARGSVRVRGAEGSGALVFAGQEAVVPKSGAVRVSSVAGLSRELGWARLGDDEETHGGEAGLAGLGELGARRPGERGAAERPLRLVRHDVRVRIAGNVARTEIEEVFRSDDARELEGVYRFPLPPGARIARLALDVDGRLEEGAFVERARAGRIWRGVLAHAVHERPDPKDDIVWVPGPWRDPALLEWQRGGRVELRIFPIPARGERRVVVGYTETLQPRGSGRRWVYPLPHASDGSTRAGRFSLDVRIAGAAGDVRPRGFAASPVGEGGGVRLAFAQDSFVPAGDLGVDFSPRDSGAEMRAFTFAGAPAATPRPSARRGVEPAVAEAERAIAADARPYVALAIRPEIPSWTEARPRDYVLVVDSSQSMIGERFARASRLAASIVAAMDRLDRFTVLACDLGCQALSAEARAPSAEAAREVSDWLGRIRPAGASNLAGALSIAAAALDGKRDAARDVHVLYVGDGVASVGHRTVGSLASRAGSIARAANVSFTTVGVGADADAVTLAAIARAGGGHHLVWRPGERASDTALAALEATGGPTLTGARVELPAGLSDVAPSALPNLRAGEEVVVTARMAGDVRGEVVVRGEVGGRPWMDRYPVALSARADAGNAFVPALWAAATIDEIEAKGRGEDRARIVALSKSFGVLSRHTSLLVLESEAMMRAFGVERTAPVATWTGEEEAVANESTGLQTHAGGMDLRAPAKSESSLGLGLVGRGRGGGGLGDGNIGLGGAGAAPSAPAADAGPARERFDRDSTGTRRAMPARPRGPGRFMRRVWFRTGGVQTAAGPSPADLRAVASAEAGLRAEPDSRARHRDLVKALARAGDPLRAQEVAEKWLGRDPMDPEALARLADAVARQGRRTESLRILSGIVEADPNARPLQRRLARAFDAVGSPALACAHRVALSEISPADVDAAAEAVRCTSAIGDRESARIVYAGLPDDDARRRAGDAASRAPEPDRAWGEVTLDATWMGAGDLDVALIAPDGTRLSFMGGRTGLSGTDAASPGRERLALRRASVGTYLVEVTRPDGADRSPASGRIAVSALGARRTLDFTLAAERAVVGRVVVRREFRLEPVR